MFLPRLVASVFSPGRGVVCAREEGSTESLYDILRDNVNVISQNKKCLVKRQSGENKNREAPAMGNKRNG